MAETTADGPFGKMIGKAKEAVGHVVGRQDLVQEGKLQSAAVDAELDAAKEAELAEQREKQADVEARQAEAKATKDRLEHEIEAEKRDQEIERQRVAEERGARAREEQRKQAVVEQEGVELAWVQSQEKAAATKLASDSREAAHLEQEARNAEAVAAAIDPEESK